MKNDCVVSYHMNPQTCGVARFNLHLAGQLGIPCYALESHEHKKASRPLVSIKPSEMPKGIGIAWNYQPYDIFLHGPSDGPPLMDAVRAFAASRRLADQMSVFRPDIIAAWCPGTIQGEASRGTYRVLTFGMAHKFTPAPYLKLKAALEAEGRDYTISLSTAVHEGTPWDSAFQASVDGLRAVFGDRLRVLGYLLDDALAVELAACDAVALYFDPAVRENNTTVWAAVAAGKRLFTNTDEWSPDLAHPERYSWARLVALIQGT